MKLKKNCWLLRTIANGSLRLKKHHQSYSSITMNIVGILAIIYMIKPLLFIGRINYIIFSGYGYLPWNEAPQPNITQLLMSTIWSFIALIILISITLWVCSKLRPKIIRYINIIKKNYKYSLLYEKHNLN